MSENKMPDFGNLMDVIKNISGEVSPNKSKPKWWQFYSYPDTKQFAPSDLINYTRLSLFFQSLSNELTLHDASRKLIGSLNISDLHASIDKIGGRLAYKAQPGHDINVFFFVFDDGALYVETREGGIPNTDGISYPEPVRYCASI